MNTILKITLVVSALALMAPEANAVFGTRRRTAVVVASVTHEKDSAAMAQSQQQAAAAQQQTAAANQQAAAANQQAAAATQQAAAAKQEAATANQQTAAVKQQAAAAPVAPPPVAAGAPLPIGTVVAALPPGCVSTPVGGVEYYYGGGNFYRAVFQGNNLVYVTAKPQ
jgi:hypothetical protein